MGVSENASSGGVCVWGSGWGRVVTVFLDLPSQGTRRFGLGVLGWHLLWIHKTVHSAAA